MPPRAQLLSRVLVEPTDISPYHLYAEYLEEKVAADGESEEIPSGYIVARPMADEVPGSDAGAPGDDEGPSMLFQVLVGGHC